MYLGTNAFKHLIVVYVNIKVSFKMALVVPVDDEELMLVAVLATMVVILVGKSNDLQHEIAKIVVRKVVLSVEDVTLEHAYVYDLLVAIMVLDNDVEADH